jgi:hypothetical protein
MALADFLHLPNSVSRNREHGNKVLVCQVPGCGSAFAIDNYGKFERHVAECSSKNSDRIDEIIAKHRETVFTRPADKEAYDHFRQGGN